jgi:hypothetical protein
VPTAYMCDALWDVLCPVAPGSVTQCGYLNRGRGVLGSPVGRNGRIGLDPGVRAGRGCQCGLRHDAGHLGRFMVLSLSCLSNGFSYN